MESIISLEQLAIGASAYSKCKQNLIDTVEDLQEAFRTGTARSIFSGSMIETIREVLGKAKIDIPEEGAPPAQRELTLTEEPPDAIEEAYSLAKSQMQVFCTELAQLGRGETKAKYKQHLLDMCEYMARTARRG